MNNVLFKVICFDTNLHSGSIRFGMIICGIKTNKKAKNQVIMNNLCVNQQCIILVLGINHKQRM